MFKPLSDTSAALLLVARHPLLPALQLHSTTLLAPLHLLLLHLLRLLLLRGVGSVCRLSLASTASSVAAGAEGGGGVPRDAHFLHFGLCNPYPEVLYRLIDLFPCLGADLLGGVLVLVCNFLDALSEDGVTSGLTSLSASHLLPTRRTLMDLSQ